MTEPWYKIHSALTNFGRMVNSTDPVRLLLRSILIRPGGYKTFFMLNSAEHEILNAFEYENIKKFSIFQAQITLNASFFLLSFCILTCMSRKKFKLS